MPLLIDTETRTAALVRSVNDVLIDHGPAGLTLRRIARVSGVSTSSILHHLGSREHLLRVAAGRTAEARLAALKVTTAADGILGFLPSRDDEVLDARAWLAWQELWRSEDTLARWIARCRSEERALLAAVTGFALVRAELDAGLALIDGLQVALCAPREPMRPEQARRILTGWAGRMLGDVTPGPPGGSTWRQTPDPRGRPR